MTNPKYDMKLNPVYQIDWQNEASGKRLAGTKRRVKFRFGFSNKTALVAGQSGTDCRGEEHEVTLVWSLSSGKRQVIANGKEVHYSLGGRYDAKVEASWTMPGGHLMKIVAHATMPLLSANTQGFRQFDLLVDGFSFFDMPKIYELGVQNKAVSLSTASSCTNESPREHAFAYPNNSGGNTSIARDGYPARRQTMHATSVTVSIASSPRRTQSMVSQPDPPQVVDLLGFNSGPTAPAPAADVIAGQFPQVVQPSFNAPPPAGHPLFPVPPQTTSVPVLANAPHTQMSHHQLQVQTQQTYYQQAPAMVSPDAFSTTGYHYGYSITNNNSNVAALMPPQQQPLVVDTEMPRPQIQQYGAVITPTMMKPLDLNEITDSPPPMDELDRALQSLVNLGDLTETMETPEKIKAKKQKEASSSKTSRPAPPTATAWTVGNNATLADMKQHQQLKAAPAKEIMRVHAFDQAAGQAGLMVVYGQQQPAAPHQQGYGGGSSIPVATGFGAGMYYGQHAQTVRAGY